MTRAGRGARDRRALLLGAAVVVPAVLFRVLLLPYSRALGDVRTRVQGERHLLARELALLSGSSRHTRLDGASGEALRAEVPRLFGGVDQFAASAELVSYLGDQARNSRLLLQQSEGRGAEAASGGIVSVQVSFRATGDLEAIMQFLGALENGPKLVRVERIAIEQTGRHGSSRGADEEALSLTATVDGFALAVEESP